jgi:hypothetical protein
MSRNKTLTRQQRRNLERQRQRGLQKITKPTGTFRDILANAAFALLATFATACIIASLSAAGIVTMTLALILLALAWLVGVAITFLLPQPITWKNRLIFSGIFGVLLLGLGSFEAANYQRPITFADLAKLISAASSHHYSSKQTIKNIPTSVGGNDTLNLDNAGTLRTDVSEPETASEITLIQNATPMKFPDKDLPGVKVRDLQVYTSAPNQKKFKFSFNNQTSHDVQASGRTFVVTLMEIKNYDVPEYEFGISEK